MIIKTNELISNSLNLYSVAKESVAISNQEELNDLADYISQHNLKYLFLGEGTNLVPPEYFDGMIIKSAFKEISNNSNDVLNVGSAVNWNELVNYSLENNIKGFENLSLIPGSVGASPIQNIGAYGVEVSSLISCIYCYDIENREFITLSNAECNFKYRSSSLKNSTLFIISIDFIIDEQRKLNSKYQSIQNYMLDNNITNDSLTNISLAKIVREIRKSVLPNHHKIFNAGSFFKNPIVNKNNINQEIYNLDQLVYWELENKMLKVGAARLIELIKDKIPDSENVSLYDKHSLVLVTNGKAIQSEVLTYANTIQNLVYETFNINLEIEPNIIY